MTFCACSPIFHNHVHFAAFARSHQLKRRSTIGCDFQKTHAAENPEDLAGSTFSVGTANTRRLSLVSDCNLEALRRAREKLRRILRSYVSNEISEAIHLQNNSSQRSLIDRLRPWCAKTQ